MPHLELFFLKGNEKADEVAKDEAMMDSFRARAVQQGGVEVYVALRYAASLHCFVKEWADLRGAQAKFERK